MSRAAKDHQGTQPLLHEPFPRSEKVRFVNGGEITYFLQLGLLWILFIETVSSNFSAFVKNLARLLRVMS